MMPSDVTGSVALDRDQVLTRVKEVVGEQLSHAPETLEERHRLEADLGADSLDLTEIAMELEEEFDISVPDDAVQEIETVGAITDRVMQLLSSVQDD
jgi:acyl carrier protein